MTDAERRQIKDALIQCAKENENRNYPTFHISVGGVCRTAKERIAELEAQVEKMKNCGNCKNFFEYIECVVEKGSAKLIGQKKSKAASFTTSAKTRIYGN